MAIPIARISVDPITIPVEELVDMLKPYVVCEKCKFFSKDSIQTNCSNTDPVMLSIVDSNGEEFSPPEKFGCMFWKYKS